jgi:shikimate dehydrogenase
MIQLGLVGEGIERSLSPRLHVILGELRGAPTSYDTFDHGPTFAPELDNLFGSLATRGFVGTNVTHPFKEIALNLVDPDDQARRIGAINTVRFVPDGTATGHRSGYNTDVSGLHTSLLHARPEGSSSIVVSIGAGGFGRAAAFALAALGVEELRIVDVVASRAAHVATHVQKETGIRARAMTDLDVACEGALGLVNSSPVGMHSLPGCPVEARHLQTVRWVFDAVYLPMKTELLRLAEALGIACITGAELFFWQAIHAHQLFCDVVLTDTIIDAARQRIWPEVLRRAETGS